MVYVDSDPIVLAHARALLTSSPEGATHYVDADLRDTGKICEQAAEICAEIAEQYCAELHAATTTAQLIAAGQQAANGPAPARA